MNTFFSAYVDWLYKYRFVILVLTVVLVGLSIGEIRNLGFDYSSESYLFPDDPKLAVYRDFQERFGSDSLIVLAVDGDVFTESYISRIYSLAQDIRKSVPFVKDVSSLVNVIHLRSEIDVHGESVLVVEDLIDGYPESPLDAERLAWLEHEVMSSPLYKNRLISEDGATSAIVVELTESYDDIDNDDGESSYADADSFDDLDTLFDEFEVEIDEEERETNKEEGRHLFFNYTQISQINEAIRPLVDVYQADDFKIAIVGDVIFDYALNTFSFRDRNILIPLFILMIMLFTLFLFKRVLAMLLSIVVIMLTILYTFALMAVFGVSLSLVTNMLPSIIISIGVGASVHFLALVYKHYDSGVAKQEAIKQVFFHSGWAIILTLLTSAAGVFSFYYSSIKSLREFALFGALGLLCILVLTLCVLPTCLLIFPTKSMPSQSNKILHRIDSMLGRHARVAVSAGRISLFVGLAIVIVSALGIRYIYFSHHAISWLPDESTIKKDILTVDEELSGGYFLEVYIDTKVHGGVYNPEFLNKMEALSQYLYAYDDHNIRVGNVFSINTILKQTNKVLNENKESFFRIPHTREEVAQELLLLESGGADILSNYIDLNYQHYRMTIATPNSDAVFFTEFLQDIDAELARLLEKDDYVFYTTGGIALITRVIDASILSAKTSYIIAFVVITLLMILLTGHIKIGLISMIPNLLPIMVLLGIIGFTPINLDIFILMIGCILLGIAVDNTIHFIHVCRQYLMEGLVIEDAILQTFLTTGKAMLISSIIMVAGFSVVILSEMKNFFYFGILAVIGIVVALFSDFFLTPALMIWMTKRGIIDSKTKAEGDVG